MSDISVLAGALDRALDTAVAAVRDQVAVALAATAAGRPARVCDVPGQLAWDACECGVLAVTVDRLYPSRQFPREATFAELASPCPPAYLVAAAAVTVLRCAPMPRQDAVVGAVPPTCGEVDAAAQVWFVDADTVRHATACALAGLRDADTIVEYSVGGQTPTGPAGGCVGSSLALLVGVWNPVCGGTCA